MTDMESCILVETDQDLASVLAMHDRLIVLFYAPWCPFSLSFLPVYEACSRDTDITCVRMPVDELPEVCDRYRIDVYPTVLYFENGQVVHRADGRLGEGLTEQQFRQLLRLCKR